MVFRIVNTHKSRYFCRPFILSPMKIKHTFLLLALVMLGLAAFAQSPNDINLSLSRDKLNISYIDLYSGNIVFSVSQKGNVRVSTLNRSRRVYEDRFTNSGKLIALDDIRLDYYDNFNSHYAGKLKSVGNIAIAYNDQFDGFDNRGRVKSIGDTKITYTDRFDGLDNRGKIKAIGGIKVTYYDRFDGAELNGKIKSIGNTVIKYYDRFDGDKAGRIKSITGKTPNVTINNLLNDDTNEDY